MGNEERYLKALKIIKENYVLILSKKKSTKLKYNDYKFVNDVFNEIDRLDNKDGTEEIFKKDEE